MKDCIGSSPSLLLLFLSPVFLYMNSVTQFFIKMETSGRSAALNQFPGGFLMKPFPMKS